MTKAEGAGFWGNLWSGIKSSVGNVASYLFDKFKSYPMGSLEYLGKALGLNRNPRQGKLMDAILERIDFLNQDIAPPGSRSFVPLKGNIVISVVIDSERMECQLIGIYNSRREWMKYIYDDRGHSNNDMAESAGMVYTSKGDRHTVYKHVSTINIVKNPILYHNIIGENYDFIHKYVMDLTDNWFPDQYIQILFDEMETLPKERDPKERDPNESSYVTMAAPKERDPAAVAPIWFLDRYPINGVALSLPFTNFDDNPVSSGCVPTYVKSRYPKITTIDLYFNKTTNFVSNIREFCRIYNIPLKLWSITGKILEQNNVENKCKRPNFYAIICNNHLYPMKRGSHVYKTELATSIVKPKERDPNDSPNIIYEINDTKYTRNGIISDFTYEKINTQIFKTLNPNFSYQEDCNVIKPISFNGNTQGLTYEYDLIKGYYNMAYNIINSHEIIPIFSCMDRWQCCTDNDIVSYNYYLISKSKCEQLRRYGFKDNLLTGYTIKLLEKYEIITKRDIEYFKSPTYLYGWDKIKNVLQDMMITTIRERIKDQELSDDQILIKYKDDLEYMGMYKFANGLLCKLNVNNTKSFYPILESDQPLMGDKWKNIGATAACLLSGDNEVKYCKFTKYNKTFNYLNNVTIYNHIIDTCNRVLLKNILEIEKTSGILPQKIRTDAIAYHSEPILPFYVEYFQIVKNSKIVLKNPNKLFINTDKTFIVSDHSSHQTYYDGREIIKKIDEQLSTMRNTSLFGEGGSGKTWKVQNEMKFDKSCTVSNVCARNMGDESKTFCALFNQFIPAQWKQTLHKLRNKTIWIDEFSMLPRYQWNHVVAAVLGYNIKFIFSGDIYQLEPVKEQSLNIDSPHFKYILGEIIDLSNSDPSANRRSDKELVTFCRTIRNNYNNKTIIKDLFDQQSKVKLEDSLNIKRHVTFTKLTRDYINSSIMIKNGYIFDKVTPNVSSGIILRVIQSIKSKGIYKSDLWEVINHDTNSITMKNKTKQGPALIKSFDVKYLKHFDIGFAITAHSSQGLTIDESIAIHDVDFATQVNNRVLYTACSRPTKFKYLNIIEDWRVPDDFTQIKTEKPTGDFKIDIYYNRLFTVP